MKDRWTEVTKEQIKEQNRIEERHKGRRKDRDNNRRREKEEITIDAQETYCEIMLSFVALF